MSHLDTSEPTDVTIDASPERIERPATMQAIVYHDYGPPELLMTARLNVPQRRQNQLLIKVYAASVNPIDVRLRKGEMKGWLPGGFPRIPGYDVAGVVVEAETGSGFAPGDRVMALLDGIYGGGYAEFAACSTSAAAKIPEQWSFEEAAALPLAGSTALQSLRDHGQIRGGQRVLINGASGGVGAFAVQIAKAYGAQVTGVASYENEAFVRSLGAISFIDYKTSDFKELGLQWDLIFDVAGTSSYRESRDVLTEHGRYVSTEPNLESLLTTAITTPFAKKGRTMLAKSRRRDLEELIRLHDSGALKVTIEQVYPLEEAEAAQRHLERGVQRGKLVLRVND